MWGEFNSAVVWTFFGIAFLWDWNEHWPFPVLWPVLSFSICWHFECSTFTASSLRVWNSSTGIPWPPLALYIVMLPKVHLIDYILCSRRWRHSIQSAKIRLGGDCGSDHELLIAKFRLKLKKVEKTTRPFRYDLNQIPYNYTVDVTNRSKGLYLIGCLKNNIWRFMTLYRGQWLRPSPRKRNAKRLPEEVFQITEKYREAKGKGEKEGYTHLNEEFQRIASRGKKAFLGDQCKEIEENNRMGRTRDFFQENQRYQRTFHSVMGQKGHKWYGPNRSRRY